MEKPILIRCISIVFIMGIAFLLTMQFFDIEPTTEASVLDENDSDSGRPAAQASSIARNTNAHFIPAVSSESNSVLDAHIRTSTIESLHEISTRVAEQQYIEGQNELDALIKLVDPLSDKEKLSLLENFITYSQNNVFNPEVVTAFDTLWNSLSMDQTTRTDSAKRLAHHYSSTYEFMFAQEQFRILANSAVSLDAALLRDLAYSQFSLADYSNAIPNLIQHVAIHTEQGNLVERREYSMLFESYYRTGDYESAQLIGTLLLSHYNDIQDWKDMQQYYLSVGNESGLSMHMENARQLGLVNGKGEWTNSL